MKSIKIGLFLVTGFLAVATFGCSSPPPAGGTGTPAATGAPSTPPATP